MIGLIELEKGNHARALRSLQTAAGMMFSETSFWPSDQALFMEPLADVFFISGDLDRAQDEYEKIRRLTMGRLRFGDIYAKSFYMTGRIFEQQGRKDKAIDNYDRFLDLWKDADPGLPEVEDAKKRLTGLKRS